MSYKIVRFYSPNLNRNPRKIMGGLTLEEAQEHCQRDDTHKTGERFDGYDEE